MAQPAGSDRLMAGVHLVFGKAVSTTGLMAERDRLPYGFPLRTQAVMLMVRALER